MTSLVDSDLFRPVFSTMSVVVLRVD